MAQFTEIHSKALLMEARAANRKGERPSSFDPMLRKFVWISQFVSITYPPSFNLNYFYFVQDKQW